MPIFSTEIFGLTIAPTWYGLMYAVSFIAGLVCIRRQFNEKDTDTLFFATIVGVILGGRLGYVLLYNFSYYMSHISEILMTWKGGMSFHGGAIGVIIAWYVAARKIGRPYLDVADQLVWIVPIGLFFGRIGNFINKELFGIIGYKGFLAQVVDGVSYFPTPLLEAFLEGFVLFLILFWRSKHIRYPGQVGVWFLGFYGVFRFVVEFFRIPDVQIGYVFSSWCTLGHVFSLCMILVALFLGYWLSRGSRTTQESMSF